MILIYVIFITLILLIRIVNQPFIELHYYIFN